MIKSATNTDIAKNAQANEMAEQLSQVMNTKYAHSLKDRRFSITTHSHKEQKSEAEVVVTLSNSDESYVYPVYGKMQLNKVITSFQEAHHLLLDFIDLYFCEYFQENEEVFLNIDYTKHLFEGQDIYIKGQIINQKLQRLANDLLEKFPNSPTPKNPSPKNPSL